MSTRERTQAATGLVLALSGVLALGIAYDAQYRLGMVPCELCLVERMPWRVLIAAGVLAALVRQKLIRAAAFVVAFACLIASVGLAVLHGGVEHGWWPSPFAACHMVVPHGLTAAERFANMPMQAAKPCDAPNYLWGLPVSMSALGGLYALAVLVLAAGMLWRLRRA
ncbi:disulfide bond formation protein B [Tanticharoenia sakaeratensis]|jgi:disulfide bond formation protein DsbB|uniref:Disulfide bond formation protein B n=1 Tax=Tanticharoenia sakaeratensis NBRC 103193 TaxID=1231623 RepID=A0A0D6MLI4_9PROT|nr:disulfide bond formation protein B [Tanticharoenia sakaeratensis]GAN54554.1 disulfide bond formation protein B [Tanticharoenia sakaeratensis NBRC 103193]GBQ24446.1 disulfide bond formation protein B [Tanticharoenia sakaeratensis NBRC 103193]